MGLDSVIENSIDFIWQIKNEQKKIDIADVELQVNNTIALLRLDKKIRKEDLKTLWEMFEKGDNPADIKIEQLIFFKKCLKIDY